MVIRLKERELIAVGISVAAGCRPCTDYHLKAVREAGGSEEEIKATIATAISVRISAANLMVDYAQSRLADEEPGDELGLNVEISRVQVLASLGAAFAVNCVPSATKFLAAAKAADISEVDIAEITQLAKFIRGKAISHVDRLVGQKEVEAA